MDGSSRNQPICKGRSKTAAARQYQNLSTKLRRTIRKAGLTPWPKLYQNLRSARHTELTDRFPIHVVCAWLGNSQSVAMEHYLQVTDEHFRQAAQKAAQSVAESALLEREAEGGDGQKTPEFPEDSESYANAHTNMVGDSGFEPLTSCVSSRRSIHLS